MKRSTLAILFTVLITLSCVFASCNAGDIIPGNDAASEEVTDSYSPLIKELEDQILELKQNQYISNSTREQEIKRLENLIADIRKGNEINDDTESQDTNNHGDESGSQADPESDTETPDAKFLYTLSGDEATITGYTGNDSSLTIPTHIDGYEVVAIADDAFTSSELSSVVISNGITKIGWFAFKACDSLKSVTVPESVSSIGYSAFPQNVSGFSIICSEGSFAEKYAESYGINTTVI